ncbi:hypothetical protein, partial [Pseudomonas helleri]
LQKEIGSTASDIRFRLGMWASWSAYGAFKQGGPSEQSLTLMDAPSQALLEALEQPSRLAEQEMAKAAILQLQYTWRKACKPSTD